MTSTSDNTQKVSFRTGPAVKKSFSSKVGSLFTSKTSHLNAFNIELDNPLKQYGPGESVKGTLVLSVAKPLGVTHVTIRLEGAVQVYRSNTRPKQTTKPNGAVRVATGRGKRWVSEYYGDGYASLFKEEIVLCGEGRLDPKLYHFRFEVDFPPGLDLPTSIEFERGTISYSLTSTITRPQSINPTITHQTGVFFRGDVDIGALPPPKLRTITLEPLERSHRSKKKPSMQRLAPPINERGRPSSEQSSESQADRSSRTMVSVSSAGATIPLRRQSSGATSLVSNGSNPTRPSNVTSERQSTETSSPRNSTQADADQLAARSIIATVKLEKSGCLAGDVVPLQISIHHTKVVRSLHGIIITLYRQARVDMHPNLPLASENGGVSGKYEDYYPRSRTGLGGLSLSAAGSSHNWRKDMSQTFAPIYIDPTTMSTNFKIGVRVPEDAFPSIRNTPGDMITFRYYVEVIIDIHGKLGQQDRMFPSLNMTSVPTSYAPNSQGVIATDEDQHALTAWGTNCVDTSVIRRDKNAVTSLCELIIGTRSSERARGKRPKRLDLDDGSASMDDHYTAAENEMQYPTQSTLFADNGEEHPQQGGYYGEYNDGYDQGYQDYRYDGYDSTTGQEYGDGYDYYQNSNYHNEQWSEDPLSPHFVPAEEEELSEKERLRRAEMHLLPSAPPDDDSWPGTAEQIPTAPYIPHEGDFTSASAFQAALHLQHPPYMNGHPSPGRVVHTGDPSHAWQYPHRLFLSSSLHGEHDPAHASSSSIQPGDDKQELERQRLAAQTSAPDYSNAEADDPAFSYPAGHVHPSAPVLPVTADGYTWAGRPEDPSGAPASDLDANLQVVDNLPRYTR